MSLSSCVSKRVSTFLTSTSPLFVGLFSLWFLQFLRHLFIYLFVRSFVYLCVYFGRIPTARCVVAKLKCGPVNTCSWIWPRWVAAATTLKSQDSHSHLTWISWPTLFEASCQHRGHQTVWIRSKTHWDLCANSILFCWGIQCCQRFLWGFLCKQHNHRQPRSQEPGGLRR